MALSLSSAAASGQTTKLVGHLETVDACEVAHVKLVIDLGGPCTTTDSGSFACDAPGLPGDEVRVLMPNHPRCLIFYPPDGRTTLRRPEARESVAITLVEKDSPRLKSTDELRRMIRASTIKRDVQALTPKQLDERLRTWADSVHEQTGSSNEAFARLLAKKQGQIQEFTKVTGVFAKFLNRGQDMVDVFRRHAAAAVDHNEFEIQLAATIRAYNEVFAEMREQGDAYLATVETYWGKEPAAEYQRLLARALQIHRDSFYQLNEVNTLINNLNYGEIKGKEERKKAIADIGAKTDAITRQADSQLADLKGRVETYLASLKETLAVF